MAGHANGHHANGHHADGRHADGHTEGRSAGQDHTPGTMDITEQEKAYAGFIKVAVYATVIVLLVLLMLAIFRT